MSRNTESFYHGRFIKFFSLLLILCTLCLGIKQQSFSGPIPENEIRLALENIIVDTEFALLVSFAGSLSGPMDYLSEVTETGWSGTLSGNYAGKELEIIYSGNTADLSSMSWTALGHWGTEAWTSSGLAQYIDPPIEGVLDIENMQVGLSVSGSIGFGSITAKLVKDLDDKELIGSISVSALDVPVLGSALSKELSLTISQKTFTYKSEEKYEVLFGLAHTTHVVNKGRVFYRNPDHPNEPIPKLKDPLGKGFNPGFNAPGKVTYNQMQIQAVPEPATIYLTVIGAGPLLLSHLRKRPKKRQVFTGEHTAA
uniref:PEP-CTERM sorting domain-containing protein n=1 Tax=Desulfacinum infernum TaxID=35837 RepID=A0A832A3R2_9BACT